MGSLFHLFYCSLSLTRMFLSNIAQKCPIQESLWVCLKICILHIFQVIFMSIYFLHSNSFRDFFFTILSYYVKKGDCQQVQKDRVWPSTLVWGSWRFSALLAVYFQVSFKKLCIILNKIVWVLVQDVLVQIFLYLSPKLLK